MPDVVVSAAVVEGNIVGVGWYSAGPIGSAVSRRKNVVAEQRELATDIGAQC